MNARRIRLTVSMFFLAAATVARADLVYTFNADVEGFQNVSWQNSNPVGWPDLPGSIMHTHTAGGWQVQLTKEFSWGVGGGSENQQLAMQALANDPTARLKLDVMVDGTSFPTGQQTWYQFILVGNSDGSTGWTQNQLIDSWQNAGQSDLRKWHFDLSFADLGFQPGDTWFQIFSGSNSDGAVPVNFYLDNVVVYAPVPEPASLALVGLGAATGLLLLRRRRRS
ncbi:MAG: PEP-CTERM sorting domain-containing protein [Pirellulaceae bacterium]|jgi:hypothetical protein|nr:PEP-CTERM sorting domain-containing protein [Pirellulaceae bacterium]